MSPLRTRPMFRSVLSAATSTRGRRIVNVLSVSLAIGLSVLAARHFASAGWPFAGIDPLLAAGAGMLFLIAYAFKAWGWQRLFAPHERPGSMALAVAGGAACVTGTALPGRFDDAVRIAVVRRYPGGCRSGVGTLGLSLFMLGLIDAVALTPMASTAAAVAATSGLARIALSIVAFGGVGAAVVVLLLPRVAASSRSQRYRLGRWLTQRTTNPLDASKAWIFVVASWVLRAFALFLLLGALGVGLSFPLALAFMCAGAASAALPIAPAGAATQAGAGAAILAASGVGLSKAIAFAVAAQAMVILAGAAVILIAAVWHGCVRLVARATPSVA